MYHLNLVILLMCCRQPMFGGLLSLVLIVSITCSSRIQLFLASNLRRDENINAFRRCSHVTEGRSGAKPSYALVELSMHVVSCICMYVQYKGVQLKFKLQHTGT